MAIEWEDCPVDPTPYLRRTKALEIVMPAITNPEVLEAGDYHTLITLKPEEVAEFETDCLEMPNVLCNG